MPKLNRTLIRTWLEDHNWTVGRLTAECNAIGEDTFIEGSVRNAVIDIDPMRPRAPSCLGYDRFVRFGGFGIDTPD